GHYGEVYKGFYHKYDGTLQPVALKMLKRSMCLKYHKEFEEEYNIMKDLKHDNIVCVIGRCTTMKVSSQVLVLEYVEKGSLREYLQKNQARLGVSILVKFGYEIACGMNFLAEKHIVHRDLASRNVLVTDDVHMKIGDFGLSRTLCPERDYYRSDENKELPAPWCAPEALEKRTFTEKTDVWSYGVTMWEIFSYGENPNLCEIKNLWMELHDGRRLEKPDICPKKVYGFIMQHCWDYYEQNRSNFRTILDDYRVMMTNYQIIE
ncbi:hypothetical protein HELRODRAFT_62957, partial [Helobdella robusta]|uniref:Protein kinase domain-containing protein n=1 Tax=Helobdella robusta TaxID=6412 RepID=T1FX84_HELRO